MFAWDSEPASLDPAIAWNLVDWQVEHAVFENLYKYAPQPGVAGTTLEPSMAVAMPVMSNGGKTYTIKLKPGILFQPPVNREVTADDFKYSFERMMRLPNAPGTYFYTNVVGATDYQAGKATHIAGYKALDRYTIQIDLEQPDLAFLNALTVDFTDPIPKEWVAKWGNRQVARHPLGTGPFMFESWTPGQEIVLTRNPNYRDAANVWLDGIKFELNDTTQSAFLKLQRGDVDVLGNNVPPANVLPGHEQSRVEALRLREPVIGTIYLFLNVQFPPLDNVLGASGHELGDRPRQARQAAHRPGAGPVPGLSARHARLPGRQEVVRLRPAKGQAAPRRRRATRTASRRRSTPTTSTRTPSSSSRSRTTSPRWASRPT